VRDALTRLEGFDISNDLSGAIQVVQCADESFEEENYPDARRHCGRAADVLLSIRKRYKRLPMKEQARINYVWNLLNSAINWQPNASGDGFLAEVGDTTVELRQIGRAVAGTLRQFATSQLLTTLQTYHMEVRDEFGTAVASFEEKQGFIGATDLLGLEDIGLARLFKQIETRGDAVVDDLIGALREQRNVLKKRK
jgi:hypothetical protein